MVELVVSLAIVLILTAVALPSLTKSFRVYQLNDSASRVASLLKFTRFEAIRKNTLISCQIAQTSDGNWLLWTDTNGNGSADPGEMQNLVVGDPTLIPAGAPPPITSAVGPIPIVVASGANSTISFDHRGAVSPLQAYVLYIGSSTNPEFDYRAVVLLPSGITQVWSAPAGGTWTRVS
jgi:type II secretory pathway pseudopilin PulG